MKQECFDCKYCVMNNCIHPNSIYCKHSELWTPNWYNYNSIFGYDIIGNPYMVDIVQARTHKKKRINKKWRKRYGVKEVPWNKFVIVGNKIYCHPTMIEKLKMEILM